MATVKSTSSSNSRGKISTPSGRKTVAELQKIITEKDRQIQTFKLVNETLKLINISKNQNRTFTSYNKDRLRQMLQNPKSNEASLRNLSLFLYRLCYSYRRLIWYNATMMDLNAVSVIPLIDITKTINSKKTLKNYYATAKKIQQLALDQCMLPMLLTAWREDTAYGYIYDDDQTCFIHVLDGQYCKVSAIDGGTLRYAFDFSYFSSHADDLEYWDSEFKRKYRKYQEGKADKWQELDYEREICLKVNIDDPTMSYPPFAPLFEQIIDLVDLQSIQAVKDELSIYKLLVARLQPLSGTKSPDDFEVDVRTALEYYSKLEESLPDEVASCISPLPIETIEFKPTDSSDVDMISNSTNNLFKNSGGSQVLNNEKSGTTITQAQVICDAKSALAALLPQVQSWCNIYLGYKLGKDHCHIKYLEVTPYTRATKKKELLESGQYGIPTKLAIAALDGFTPLEALSLLTIENDVMLLHERMIPLSSSWTKTGDQNATGVKGEIGQGAPEKDPDELTDDGSKSRENG